MLSNCQRWPPPSSLFSFKVATTHLKVKKLFWCWYCRPYVHKRQPDFIGTPIKFQVHKYSYSGNLVVFFSDVINNFCTHDGIKYMMILSLNYEMILILILIIMMIILMVMMTKITNKHENIVINFGMGNAPHPLGSML